MKLLLHICCAPCLIYPLEKLREEGYEVRGFFYNPNIHPFAEYEKRKQAVVDFSESVDVKVDCPEYKPEEFLQAINLKEDKPQRCSICWHLRLRMTAQIAKEKRCRYFSTTLLVSPYQDHELLKKIGNDISKKEKIGFYCEDFRPGFRKAHAQAHANGIYCQKYCGCIYSEVERYKKKV